MKRMHLDVILASVAVVASLSWGVSPAEAQSENVLIILADDLGVDILETYNEGSTFPPTPTIDMLRETGVLFRNVWSNPICSPTRATILTGRYGIRTGIGSIVNHGEGVENGLSYSEILIPEMLDLNPSLGYANAIIGKWHLTPDAQDGDDAVNLSGFAHFSGTMGNLTAPGVDYFNWPKTVNGETFDTTVYATTDNVNDAIEWINAREGNPWFLYLPFNTPHNPRHVPPEDLHSYDLDPDTATELEKYQAMVEAMDTEIGRLFASISPDVFDNTNIIFLGDNGSPSEVTEPPFDPSHAKLHLYEGGVNVPLIVSGPRVANPGSETDILVVTTDLFGTALEMMGVDVDATLPPDVIIDSVSFLPALEDTPFEPRAYAYSDKFADPGDEEDGRNGRAIRDTDGYKLIRFFTHPEEFYDLNADPFETTDLLLGELDPVQQAHYDDLSEALDAIVQSACENAVEGGYIPNDCKTVHNLTQGIDYVSIQLAIDEANEGDEIEVDARTYFESIDFGGKAITLRSTDPFNSEVVDDTIIDGGGLSTVVTLSAGTLSGFTIQNGSGSGANAGGVEASGTAAVSWNVIMNNVAEQRGGGVSATGSVLVQNNRIINNEAENRAGGVSARDDSVVINNFISGNSATAGGGGVRAQENSLVRNNTITNNSSADSGGGTLGGGGVLAESSSTILNNIIAFSTDGAGLHVDPGATVTADYNCIFGNLDGEYGGDAQAGPHDLNADPQLEEDGIHIDLTSPCVDAGDPALIPLESETDLDQQPRIQNDRVDIGADEVPPCDGDANGDGTVDPLDAGFVLARLGCPVGTGDPACDAADVNADGMVDPLDMGYVLARFGECE